MDRTRTREAALARTAGLPTMDGTGRNVGHLLGRVIAGSLSEGLEARLDLGTSVEDMAVGRYVVVQGEKRRFFGMVTDVRLEVNNPQVAGAPPVTDDFVAEVIAGTTTYGVVEVQPMLTVEGDPPAPRPVKTVPTHFSAVREASDSDVEVVFGKEDETHFYVGQPIDMQTRVCLDLKRLVERSSGVFGKSGTGKTFITRLLLAGIVRNRAAVNLVFDMHNEYGWKGTAEGSHEVKGLKQLYGDRIRIFTLDPLSTSRRGATADFTVEIGYDQIEPDDIAMLREALGLSEAAIESLSRISRKLGGRHWFSTFVKMDPLELEEYAKAEGLNASTLNVLHRKLAERIARLPFVKENVPDDSVRRILQTLQAGNSVVLEFGRQSALDAYILVANILTRRIHEAYVDAVERSMADDRPKPTPLVITIEEAHKFLSPDVADLTIFGTIAREMRKYNVTLLIVDQRPSEIDEEVMSQIGTRITCLLDNDRDTAAVLGGIPGATGLRSVLARLETKQQAIILGHAVPMPVAIRTRDYGTEESYAELRPKEKLGGTLKEIFG
jgi:uncharacterized protein